MNADWQIREADYPRDLLALAAELQPVGEIALLDGSPRAVTHSEGQWGMLCADPLAIVEQYDGCEAELHIQGRLVERDPNGWRLWRRTAARLPRLSASPCGMSPGWVGYAGFEMAGLLERLPHSHREDLGTPLLRMALFDRGLVVDHANGRAWSVAAPMVRGVLGAGGGFARGPSRDHPPGGSMPQEPLRAAGTRSIGIEYEVERAEYERMVGKALDYIAAGDVYQVNLSHRLLLERLPGAFTVAESMRRSNPAPFACLLRWAGLHEGRANSSADHHEAAIVSASPELFVRVHGRQVVTRPIKGTRPRTGDSVLDRAHREALLNSPKDAAELAMIVDLHRNDLGRVCAYGSVRVEQARFVEEHPTVFHTVAEVRGDVANGRDAFDVLEACFPAGSVTGAPKIRAMEIIDELERAARGAYTGAIGAVGLDGSMAMNVAIRTVQMRGTRGCLHVGGGIVADSDPGEEYEETLAKGRGILRALQDTRAQQVPVIRRA